MVELAIDPIVEEETMFIVKLVIGYLVLFVIWRLIQIWKLGVKLTALPHGTAREQHIHKKIDVWNSSLCLMAVAIIAIEVSVRVVAQPRENTAFFLAHLGAAVTFLFLFVFLRFWTGVKRPNSHRILAYGALMLFTFVTLSGSFFLWNL